MLRIYVIVLIVLAVILGVAELALGPSFVAFVNGRFYVAAYDLTVPFYALGAVLLVLVYRVLPADASGWEGRSSGGGHGTGPSPEVLELKRYLDDHWEKTRTDALPRSDDGIEASGASIDAAWKRFYQCPTCGAIHFKNETTLDLVRATGTVPSGGSTCTDCGTRSDAGEIYSGALDLDVDDDVIEAMLENPSEATHDDMTKVWRFRGREIRGPASTG